MATRAEIEEHYDTVGGARLKDYKDLGAGELGIFDGIVSLGAFAHFCSAEEQLAGKQENRICFQRKS